MKKLMRRIATAGVSATVAGGALLAAGGSATAATAHTARDVPAGITTVNTGSGHGCRHHHNSNLTHRLPDAWVAGQLAMFEPAAAKRLAVFDPWVKDQLALFAGTAR
ncbi:hypothetical protein ABZ484_08245 [Streptomyces sp. NPDC006393]|uniref:hypothetical protein n=1 Tax=Streptomyces sp. NPDC006393 TaxID=3156763 RepID=UPI0033C2B662